MHAAHWKNAMHEAWAFITHRVKCQSAHDIHSPFVFGLITDTLSPQRFFDVFSEIENERTSFLNNHSLLEVLDFGAGSRTGSNRQRRISEIAAHALQPPSSAQLIFRLVNYLQPATILELGTSLGITTAYMASACKSARLISIEGAESVAACARQVADRLGLKNVCILSGSFEDQLPGVLNDARKVDFALVDGNHRYEPTMRYFTQIMDHVSSGACLIFDDIHWSAEMEKAWNEIVSDRRVSLSIDFFDFGIIFLDPRFTKERLMLPIP
jgi:predicted O-methyltransferase YrrM